MNPHSLYFKHPVISRTKKCVFAYGNNYAYKFDDQFNYVNQEPVSFPFVSNVSNGFPCIKMGAVNYGIPLNSKKLFAFKAYEIREVCEAPSVYVFGYCQYRKNQILCFDYFRNKYYLYNNQQFGEVRLEYDERDVQCFNVDQVVYLFSKNSQFCGVIDLELTDQVEQKQVGYLGQIVFQQDNVLYTNNQKLIVIQDKVLRIHQSITFIGELHFAKYFNKYCYKNNCALTFESLFSHQIVDDQQFDLDAVAKRLLLSEETSLVYDNDIFVHQPSNLPLKSQQERLYEESGSESNELQNQIVQQQQQREDKDKMVMDILSRNNVHALQRKPLIDEVRDIKDMMCRQFDQIDKQLQKLESRLDQVERAIGISQ